MANSLPLVYALVLNYNGCEINDRCLKSLLAQSYSRLRVLFIDNGSTDDSLAQVKQTFGSTIEYLENEENFFFAAGNNRGIIHALDSGADYLFIVNNDTELASDCVSHLVNFMMKNQNAGGCQPIIYDMDTPDAPMEWQRRRSIASAGIKISLSGRSWDDTGFVLQNSFPKVVKVSGITGGAMFLASQPLRRCGFFDENFVMYFEDVDLSLRLQKSGYELYLVPEATIGHLKSATSKKYASSLRIKFCETNCLRIIQKHFPPDYKFLAIIISSLFSCLAVGKHLLKGSPRVAGAVFSGYLKGMRGFLFAQKLTASEVEANRKIASLIMRSTLFPP